MRHCFSEAPEVYEHEGSNLADVLRVVADKVEELEDEPTWVNVVLHHDLTENVHRATLYVH